MSRIAGRLRERYAALDRRDKLKLWGVVGAMVGSMLVQAPNWNWFVEDAAISFSYARYWAEGEGLVPFPGAERVEGYSNPLWVLILTAFHLIGVQGWISARVLGALLGAATIPLVYFITYEARGRRDDWVPLLATWVLVGNAQFAIWNGSGLENSLFNLLLCGGVWRTLVEARKGGFPTSSIWFLLLAVTRPEAIAYGAVGGFAAMVWSLRAGRGLGPTIKWLLVFFLPFGIYHYLRYQYFAWPFPMTYYAKLGHRTFKPLEWDYRGWVYARDYAGIAGIEGLGRGKGPGVMLAYISPVFWAAGLGLGGKRTRVWAALSIAFLLAMAVPPPAEWFALIGTEVDLSVLENETWLTGRTAAIYLLMCGMPLVALWRRVGGRAVALVWAMAVVTLLFCLKASGDWMKGYRWFNMLAPMVSILAALGIAELVEAFARRRGQSVRARSSLALGGLLTAGVVGPHIRHMVWFSHNRVTSPYGVMKRVNFRNQMQAIAHLDDITLIDVDMGAHMWYSEDRIIDMAGLIDVPVAQHRNNKRFHDEYLFEEMWPEFAHIHDAWSRKSRIPSRTQFKDRYLPLPGYVVGRRQESYHVGSHMLRDVIFRPQWDGEPGRRFELDGGLVIEGFDMPGLPAVQSKDLFVELGLGWTEQPEDWPLFDVLGAISRDGEVVTSFALEAFYGWYDEEDWGGWPAEEVAHLRYSISLPEFLEPGSYDLHLAVLTEDGDLQGVRPPEPELAGEAEPADEAPVAEGEIEVQEASTWVFARGEATLPGAIQIIGRGEVKPTDSADWEALEAAGRAGDVDAADAAWFALRWRHTKNESWWKVKKDEGYRWRALARVGAAEATEDVEEQALLLREAWEMDHLDPEIRSRTDVFADLWQARGQVAYDMAKALQEATAGDCAGATRGLEALQSPDPEYTWLDEHLTRAEAALDDCQSEDFDATSALDVELMAWNESFTWMRRALFADMRRSWARRYMEEARGQRLDLDDDSVARRRREASAARRERQRSSRRRAPTP